MSKQSKRERQRLNRELRLQYQASIDRRRRVAKSLIGLAAVVVPVVAVVVALGLLGDDEQQRGGSGAEAAAAGRCRDVEQPPPPKDDTFAEAAPTITDHSKTYDARVHTSCGSFTIQLADDEAPATVNSFAFLAEQGFYDGLTFHRLVKDFVIQGGDPKGDGTGGPGYTLPDEPPADGYQQGTVALANSGPGTSGSQFFVVTTDEGAANLGGPPYLYSILGQVTDGFETVRRIENLAKPDQTPKSVVVIDRVTISDAPPS